MNKSVQSHLNQVLHHLYINPLEKCNLKCKICYTRKTSPILSKKEILDFIDRYQQEHELQTITFCGGEVFALSYFPTLVNKLTDEGIFVQIITNGTIDKTDKLTRPNSVNLIVSLDGLEDYHDANRGTGNFRKSINFLQKAQEKGFHTEIFSIITQQNLKQIDVFEAYLQKHLRNIPVTYHPRKPPSYLMHHPVSNIVGETNGFDFLTQDEMKQVMKERNVFPPQDLGCYQIALMSDGTVYGCCEGITPLGQMDDDITFLTDQLRKRLTQWENTNNIDGCLGCSQPDFVCGIKNFIPR
jgi:sulfatase maturation enzyme AslB (radical SAM superfamily)